MYCIRSQETECRRGSHHLPGMVPQPQTLLPYWYQDIPLRCRTRCDTTFQNFSLYDLQFGSCIGSFPKSE
ncbi:hypothetical protein Mapa_007058 [Marchantia paleacea]|nr:hypothetical protein Mapa_007058 [Marchantia paleacea]